MESEQLSPADDNMSIRCPRLGHNLGFFYCYKENSGLPCFKILDCWFEHFDVRSYLQQNLTPAQLNQVFRKTPQPKVLSLLELIKRANGDEKDAPAGKGAALVGAD